MKKRIVFIIVLLCIAALTIFIKIQKNDAIYIAVVGPFSNQGESVGKSLLRGVNVYCEMLNIRGGVNGKKIKLDIYDDQNDKNIAKEIAHKIVKQNRALGVIGHYYSSCSICAGKIYKDYKIPAITPGSTNVMVTKNNDWYFRTVYNDNLQGRFLANYAIKVLHEKKISIIYDDDAYGYNLARVFENTSKELGAEISFKQHFNNKNEKLADALNKIIDDLYKKNSEGSNSGAIFLATHSAEGIQLVKRIKDYNIKNIILTPDSFASKSFQNGFSEFQKEKIDPGFYTNGIYTTTPIIFDTANELAQNFQEIYENRYKEKPDWRAAFAYDTAMIMISAINSSGSTGDSKLISSERELIRDHLSKLNNIQMAIKGVTGYNYFDNQGDSAKPVSIGMYKNNNLISAPTQLQVIHNPNKIVDIESALNNESILSIDGKLMYKTNVVYTGIEINEISDLDIRNLTYFLDFDLWFRYQGDINPQNIIFLDSVIPVNIGKPVVEKRKNRVVYKRYHVKGKFKADFLPLRLKIRQHILGVSFRHKHLSRNNLIYVEDIIGMKFDVEKSILERFNEKKVLSPIYGWSLNRIIFYQDIDKKNAEGDPDYLYSNGGIVDCSRFNLGMRIRKNQFSLRGSIPPEIAKKLFIAAIIILISIFFAIQSNRFVSYSRILLFIIFIISFFLLILLETIIIDYAVERLVLYQIQLIIRGFDILWWTVPATFLNFSINRFVWIPLEKQTGRKIPDIARLFFVILIYMLAFFGIIAFVFDQKIHGLLATSGMLAMIIGLAIQINISNVFSGIAINLERPFRTGDWVKIGDYDEGKVIDITWRSTLLQTRNDCILNIPNSNVSESDILNYHYPDDVYRSWFNVYINQIHSPNRIKKILHDSLLTSTDILKEPSPRVYFLGLTNWSAEYLVAFSARDYGNKIFSNQSVWLSVWTHLNRAGIRPAIQRHDVRMFQGIEDQEDVSYDPLKLIHDVDLFKSLSDENKYYLSVQMREHRYKENEVIIKQGDTGDSLFLISEGAVSVRIDFNNKEEHEIVRLGSGNFFGEMALLTGEKRSATIISITETRLYEITKKVLARLIIEQPEVAQQLSDAIISRTKNNEKAKYNYSSSENGSDSDNLSNIFLKKFLSYFGI